MNNKKIIIIGIIFVAIVITLLAYIYYGGVDSSQEAQNQSTVQQVDETQTSSQIISSQESFSKFNTAVITNDLVDSLDQEATIFVPNNQAFESLPETDKITETLDKDITGYHIVRGVFAFADLTDGQKLPTVTGQELVVLIEKETTYVLDAKGNKVSILSADLKTQNGYIHEVDQVFLPQ